MNPKRPQNLRRNLAVVAFVFSVAALIVETATHICASALFDPLPDGSTTAAYWFVAAMLLFNEYALSEPRRPRTWLQDERLWGAAMTGTAVCLPLVAATVVMFLPVLPIAVVFIPLFGLGLLAWAPLLVFGILIAQMRALCRRWIEEESGVPRREVITSLLCGVIALTWLVVRPIAVGHYLNTVLKPGTEYGTRPRCARVLGIESAVLALCYQKQPPYWVECGREGTLPFFRRIPLADDTLQARKYYQFLTGRAYDTTPIPAELQRQISGGDD